MKLVSRLIQTYTTHTLLLCMCYSTDMRVYIGCIFREWSVDESVSICSSFHKYCMYSKCRLYVCSTAHACCYWTHHCRSVTLHTYFGREGDTIVEKLRMLHLNQKQWLWITMEISDNVSIIRHGDTRVELDNSSYDSVIWKLAMNV